MNRISPSLSSALTPINTEDRTEWLDALRGFALLGILLINIMAFSGYAFLPPQERGSLAWSGLDDALNYVIHALIEAKFYSLFSFLFGLGFAVQLRRAEERGLDVASVFRRRMAWLLLFGLAHAAFIWFGDVLNFYALMGFALLLFRNLSARALLAWAVFFLTAPIWIYACYLTYATLLSVVPAAPSGPPAAFLAILDGYANGSYLDVMQSNVQIYAFSWARRIYRFQLLRILGMFLLGAWAGKIGFPQARDALRPLLKRWLMLGIVIGLPLNFAFAAIGGNDALMPAGMKGLISITLGSIGIPLLSLGYASLFGLYWSKVPSSGNLLVASGRMALSHYLGQSIICVLIFYGMSGGLFGKVSLGVALLIAVGVYLILASLCRIQLKRCARGPMEALWRRLSYGAGQRPFSIPWVETHNR